MALDWDDETKISAKEEMNRPAPQDRDRAYLIVLAGSSVGEMYKITAESTVIGRGQQADIQVIDEGISRRHAEIMHIGGDIVIRDLGLDQRHLLQRRSHQRAPPHRRRQDPGRLDDHPQVHLPRLARRELPAPDVRVGAARRAHQDLQQEVLPRSPRERVRLRGPPQNAAVAGDVRHRSLQEASTTPTATSPATTCCRRWPRSSSDTIRQEDVFARYGGEEFAVICRGIDLTGALAFGERIRRCVDAQAFVYNGVDIKVTVSVGVVGGARGRHEGAAGAHRRRRRRALPGQAPGAQPRHQRQRRRPKRADVSAAPTRCGLRRAGAAPSRAAAALRSGRAGRRRDRR